jgi:hypothetical protein
MLLTGKTSSGLIRRPTDKRHVVQLFKHEFATSKCFWPKLKDRKNKDLTHTSKVFLHTKIEPKNFWQAFNT